MVEMVPVKSLLSVLIDKKMAQENIEKLDNVKIRLLGGFYLPMKSAFKFVNCTISRGIVPVNMLYSENMREEYK